MDSDSEVYDSELDFFKQQLSPGAEGHLIFDEEEHRNVIENSCQYSHIKYDQYESA